ncbi:MAG TPA: hypothetical protein DCR55_00920 [Lentisphaeria bacterium]|nr:hypothetical protein [Lentisphaeria bacterium]
MKIELYGSGVPARGHGEGNAGGFCGVAGKGKDKVAVLGGSFGACAQVFLKSAGADPDGAMDSGSRSFQQGVVGLDVLANF